MGETSPRRARVRHRRAQSSGHLNLATLAQAAHAVERGAAAERQNDTRPGPSSESPPDSPTARRRPYAMIAEAQQPDTHLNPTPEGYDPQTPAAGLFDFPNFDFMAARDARLGAQVEQDEQRAAMPALQAQQVQVAVEQPLQQVQLPALDEVQPQQPPYMWPQRQINGPYPPGIYMADNPPPPLGIQLANNPAPLTPPFDQPYARQRNQVRVEIQLQLPAEPLPQNGQQPLQDRRARLLQPWERLNLAQRNGDQGWVQHQDNVQPWADAQEPNPPDQNGNGPRPPYLPPWFPPPPIIDPTLLAPYPPQNPRAAQHALPDDDDDVNHARQDPYLDLLQNAQAAGPQVPPYAPHDHDAGWHDQDWQANYGQDWQPGPDHDQDPYLQGQYGPLNPYHHPDQYGPPAPYQHQNGPPAPYDFQDHYADRVHAYYGQQEQLIIPLPPRPDAPVNPPANNGQDGDAEVDEVDQALFDGEETV